jgi:hypothetical protein
MCLTKPGCEDGRWIIPAPTELNFCVSLPDSVIPIDDVYRTLQFMDGKIYSTLFAKIKCSLNLAE